MAVDEHEQASGPWWRFPPLRNALIAGAITATAFGLERSGAAPGSVAIALYVLAIPVGAWLWTREGLEELAHEREIGIEILMLAATIGAAALGMWEEAAALVVLYGAAEGIEEYTFARTRRAIRALLDLAPKQAVVLRDGREVVLPAETLRPGDHFLLRPGESAPTDGVIVEGRSSLDESPVTGESMPVDKGPGDRVFAASINGPGALVVRATASYHDNTLARIIELVERAQSDKGRAQAWIERFGRRYSPLVLLSALLMVVGAFATGASLAFWTERAVVLLVAAAPCALVISLPITMAAGISGAGRRGILIKGGAHLEHLGVVELVAFDKTGTLTHGRPEVTDVVPAPEVSDARVLAIAAALERNSEHPIAHAIVAHAREAGCDIPDATEFEALTGSGAHARIDGNRFTIGKPALFAQRGLDLSPWRERIERLEGEGKTVVLLADPSRILGLLALEDTVREEARAVIEALHRRRIRTVMLTGDNERTARRIAAQIGIDEVRAGLLPDDKVAAIAELERTHRTLMVGDGVNDAPALAAATCGVAMGAAGTDAAIEAADVALMADDLRKLLEAIELGHKARRVSAQNIAFSLVVLAILIPAGVGGAISVPVAVGAHEASELLAVANGLRARRP